ncbi:MULTISPECIES: extracellular solute-binding protein [unclassified Marinitoga]|uniref:extracellular solute-binding protein n=1 Tax=unclassified Marinitoga TaxID=2640159 RepID=UPI000640F123|nr:MULTISPECIES: extracellular solute-binding protein [unclassified Marinitoga]KLO23976.1 hypothetical protein X274_05485 [Marinitoga sp. 1155]NUU99158.1 hypothetical protein [Marinitoga sp. 1154]
MKFKVVLIIFIVVLISIYAIFPRKNINIVTQMSESETKGLEKILNSYKLFHMVKFNIERIPFSGHFSRIKQLLDLNHKIDIARVDIKMPEWFESYIKDKPILQSVDCLVMLYNKKHIKKPPRTLNELWDYIENNIKDIYGNNINSPTFDKNKIEDYVFYMPYNSGWWMSAIFLSEDKNFLTSNVNKKRFINIAEKIKFLYKNNLIPKITENFYDDMINMFVRGEVDIIFNGPWSFSTYKEKGFDFGVSIIPFGIDGSFSPMGGQQWVLLNKSSEAEKVMEYLSKTEVAKKFYKYNNTIMPDEKFLEELDKKEDIVAKQLKTAIKIDKKTDYILFKFFSTDFIMYLNDKMDSEELYNRWLKMVK